MLVVEVLAAFSGRQTRSPAAKSVAPVELFAWDPRALVGVCGGRQFESAQVEANFCSDSHQVVRILYAVKYALVINTMRWKRGFLFNIFGEHFNAGLCI